MYVRVIYRFVGWWSHKRETRFEMNNRKLIHMFKLLHSLLRLAIGQFLSLAEFNRVINFAIYILIVYNIIFLSDFKATVLVLVMVSSTDLTNARVIVNTV